MDKNIKIAVMLSAYDKMSTVVNSAVDKAQKKLNGLKKFAGGLDKLGNKALVGGLAGSGVIVAALKSYADIEKMQVSLKTALGGNKEAADAAFKSIQNFAAKTPYEMGEVMTAFVKLKNMGLDPSEAALSSYGNTAAAMDKDLNQMIEAVADAATGEFERLKEFGIKAKQNKDTVAFTFQGTTTIVKKNAAQIEAYLQKIGRTKFGSGMEDQSKTLWGQLSTLKDNFVMTAAAIGKVFVPMINRLFARISPLIEKMQLFIQQNPQIVKWIGIASVALVGLGAAAKAVAFVMGGLGPVLKGASMAIRFLGTTMSLVSRIFLLNPIGLAVVAIAGIVYLIYRNWGAISGFFAKLWNSVTKIFNSTMRWIKNLFLNYTPVGLVINHWAKISTFFSGLWEKVKSIFFSALGWLKKIFFDYSPAGLIYNHWGELVEWFTKLWEKVVGIFSNAWKKIKSFFGFGGDDDASNVAAAYEKSLNAVNKKTAAAVGFNANSTVTMAGGFNPVAGSALRPSPVSANSTLTYSPTINFAGGTPQEQAAFREGNKQDFAAQIKAYEAKKARVSF